MTNAIANLKIGIIQAFVQQYKGYKHVSGNGEVLVNPSLNAFAHAIF